MESRSFFQELLWEIMTVGSISKKRIEMNIFGVFQCNCHWFQCWSTIVGDVVRCSYIRTDPLAWDPELTAPRRHYWIVVPSSSLLQLYYVEQRTPLFRQTSVKVLGLVKTRAWSPQTAFSGSDVCALSVSTVPCKLETTMKLRRRLADKCWNGASTENINLFLAYP